MKVSDLVEKNEAPKVAKTDSIAKVIIEISEKRLGVTAVVENDKIIGFIILMSTSPYVLLRT